jgi:hypothetical protein
MSTTKITVFAGVAVLIAAGLVLAIRTNRSASTRDGAGTLAVPRQSQAQLNELNPFTHVASIPASVDPSSIRFEKLRTVELASRTKTTVDPQRCKELQSRDPDGSTCQTTAVLERVKAIEALYSFSGVELGAGESVPGRSSFSVYFKPQEVAADGPVDKLKRDQAASMFLVTTYRPLVEEKVVDKEHSHYCDGNYLDGNWVKTDSNCQDQVQFITQTVPSPNLAVQVDVRQPMMASR